MIDIQEHWTGIYSNDCLSKLQAKEYKKTFTYKKSDEQSECFSLIFKEDAWHLSSSYYIGIDWLDIKSIPIRISPKVNKKGREINYLSMLEDVLKEPENFNHLDGLVEIDFEKPYIKIPQNEDFLSLFLISEYLHIIEVITKKGIKKSYYNIEENLQSKIKGKLLLNQHIKRNLITKIKTNNYCRHQEYGKNIPENKLLKKALLICCKQLDHYNRNKELLHLQKIALKILPYWKDIDSNADIKRISDTVSNRFYSEYPTAINIAKLIIRKIAFVHINNSKDMTMTPPYWIDMSKLFEMYVYQKLRNRYQNRVIYHWKGYRKQEPDFLLLGDTNNSPYVIDAKYKPRYKNELIDIDDIRQVSGYARMIGVHKKLCTDEKSIIPCLIIYTDQDAEEYLKEELDFEKEKGYIDIYKTGIKLPEIDRLLEK